MPVTADNWNVDADGDWSDASNWSLGTVPTSNNDVTISTTDVHTITMTTGDNAVNQLTVGSTDHFDFSGGSLEILTTASFADGYTQTGGTLVAGAVSITGPGILTGGAATGSTTFTITGTIALGNYTLAGAAVLNNSATTNQTAQITLGDDTGVDATINNETGAVYDIAGDFGIGAGAASASFVNAGVLEKGSGAGTSAVGVNVDSTLTITARSGNLEFEGATNSISGTLNGAGEISFGGGVTQLGAVTITAGALGLYGAATLNLGANITFANDFYDQSFGTTTLDLGAHTLTLSGAASVMSGDDGSAFVTGTGTLQTKGGLSLSNVAVGGTLKLYNIGAIDQTGGVTIGDGSGAAPSIDNAAAGTWDFAADVNLGENNTTVTFTNAGTLEKTGLGGASLISLAVHSSGQIDAVDGALDFNNFVTNTGTLDGAGAIAMVDGGVLTLETGSVLSVANFGLYDTATLDLDLSLTYAGVFGDVSFGNNLVDLGANTLTLTGASNSIEGSDGSAIVDGSGTLANTGTITVANAVIGGSVTLDNSGLIVQTGSVTAGDGSGAAPAIVNAASGTWDFTTDVGIGENAATVTFTNAGLLEKTGLGGVSQFTTAVVNSGQISALDGTFSFTTTLTNTGTLAGSGAVALVDGAVATLAAGTVLGVANVDVYDTATLDLDLSLTYAGVLSDDSFGNNLVDLGANTLTLTGASNTIEGADGSAVVDGSGTLANAGTLTLASAVVGGAATLDNTGTINQTGNVTIGDGSGLTASIVNAAGGAYNIVAGVGIGSGAATTSAFDNSGNLTIDAGSGAAVISTTLNNLAGGVINIATGALENNGVLFDKGTLSGTDLILINGSQTTLDSASANLSVKQIVMNEVALLTLDLAVTYTGTFIDAAFGNDEINLQSYKLTLDGNSQFDSNDGSDVITGSGVLYLVRASLFEGSNTEIGGTATLAIDTTVTATGNLQVGDGSANAASAVIEARGIYDLTDDTGVSRGASEASTLTVDGLLEKTAGTGTSVISVDVVNNGTISVTSGTIEILAGDYSGTGAIVGTVTHDQQGDTFISAAATPGPAAKTPVAAPQSLTQAMAAFVSPSGEHASAAAPTRADLSLLRPTALVYTSHGPGASLA